MPTHYYDASDPLGRQVFDFILSACSLIGVMEAAVFAVGEPAGERAPLRLLSHVSSATLSDDEIRDSVSALREFVRPSLAHDENVTTLLAGDSEPGGTEPYCLSLVLRDYGRTKAVAAFICLATDIKDALDQMIVLTRALERAVATSDGAPPAQG